MATTNKVVYLTNALTGEPLASVECPKNYHYRHILEKAQLNPYHYRILKGMTYLPPDAVMNAQQPLRPSWENDYNDQGELHLQLVRVPWAVEVQWYAATKDQLPNVVRCTEEMLPTLTVPRNNKTSLKDVLEEALGRIPEDRRTKFQCFLLKDILSVKKLCRRNFDRCHGFDGDKSVYCCTIVVNEHMKLSARLKFDQFTVVTGREANDMITEILELIEDLQSDED